MAINWVRALMVIRGPCIWLLVGPEWVREMVASRAVVILLGARPTFKCLLEAVRTLLITLARMNSGYRLSIWTLRRVYLRLNVLAKLWMVNPAVEQAVRLGRLHAVEVDVRPITVVPGACVNSGNVVSVLPIMLRIPILMTVWRCLVLTRLNVFEDSRFVPPIRRLRRLRLVSVLSYRVRLAMLKRLASRPGLGGNRVSDRALMLKVAID